MAALGTATSEAPVLQGLPWGLRETSWLGHLSEVLVDISVSMGLGCPCFLSFQQILEMTVSEVLSLMMT